MSARGESSVASVDSKRAVSLVVLCWFLVVFDGYDLIVYGVIQNSLIEKTEWGLTNETAGTLGSLAFLGMLVGALAAGRVADSWGRRRTIVTCTLMFSLFTVLCAFAPNAAWFGVLRFLAGLGIGGLLPSANAVVVEVASPRWRSMAATAMMSGIPLGGAAAALLGLQLIPRFGWTSMFMVGGLGVLVAVVAWVLLPETFAAPSSAARDGAAFGFRGVLRAPFGVASWLFAAAAFAGLFAWYGLATWLPRLMMTAGYDLGSALSFSLTLSVGAVVGSLLSALAGDRFGPLVSGGVCALIAAGSLMVLVVGPPVPVIYTLLVLAGIGTHGSSCLLLAAIANHFPAHLRGTALGWALGLGRVGAVVAPQLGGLLLGGGLGIGSNLTAFAVGAALAGGIFLFVWSRKRGDAAWAGGQGSTMTPHLHS